MPPLPPVRTLAVVMLAALALSACRTDRDALPPAEPVDPDAMLQEGDTAMTPLGVPEHVGEVGSEARATVEPVGPGDVAGMVLFQQVGATVYALAEIGGLQNREYALRVVDARSCANLDDAPALADLGALDVADDGTGLMEEAVPDLALSGPQSVIGRAVVITQDGAAGRIVSCGVIGPSVQ